MNILPCPHPSLFRRLLLLAGLAAFSACSVDELPDNTPDGGNASDAYPLTITVSDSGYTPASGTATRTTDVTRASGTSTRTAENQYTTTFTAGDAIGVYAIDKNGHILPAATNLRLEAVTVAASDAASGGSILTWQTADGKTPLYIPGGTYYAYYPYQADSYMAGKVPDTATGPLAASTTAADFFKDLTAAWSPSADQSSHDKYTAQDLMIAKGSMAEDIPAERRKLSFSMAHRMALVVIDLPKTKYTLKDAVGNSLPDYIINAPLNVAFSDFIPCHTDNGAYRYLITPVPADAADAAKPLLSGSYTKSDASVADWSFNADVAAGDYKEYVVDGGSATVITKAHTLQAGDFYMKDGSLIGKNESLSAAQQVNCIGIVFCTDASRIGAGEKTKLKDLGVTAPHGLVMALTNASDGCKWGDYTKDENADGQSGEPFKENIATLQKQYNDINGYAETHWIGDKIKGSAESSYTADTYKAFDVALNYGATTETAQYAAPEKTTGWFLPSMGQWWDILENFGGLDLSSYKTSTDSYVYIYGAGNTAITNLNVYMGKVTGAASFETNTYFWSSSEFSSNVACSVNFSSGGSLNLNWLNKNRVFVVRPALAF
ncbi:fimbrillin family protein [Bacteroides sp. AM10-21B]|uniref:fimbrillin family protein n=1 Tax=Bacteroides sp. AM10-21B TaxID=2292001 RepID=UPI000E51504C|nr:fimbrillin family protein [Bacteroides sp. AM10-21B]RHJ48258.1 hypothetical protein DW121_14705 [Bacteroides sp. AM10-21B]